MKMKMRGAWLFASTLAVTLSISACMPAAAPGTLAGAALAWEVGFELSGGIAGTMKQMTISHDGRLVGQNLRRRTSVERRLSADQLREIHRLIERAQPAPETAVRSLGRCADCMHYRLTVTGPEGRPRVLESGSIEQQQSRNPDLIRFLIVIINEAVQS
jgi:hypothetical protein